MTRLLMHASAFFNASLFKKIYLSRPPATVVEIGSQIVAGQQSLRDVFGDCSQYIGVDFCPAPGVDILLSDPYQIPLLDGQADVIISSSCFEHSEFFWLTFLEICRVCKDGGLIYLNMPTNGSFHRYPVDCWRFYPDSGIALQNWALRNGLKVTLLESYVANQQDGQCWSDFVSVYGKGDSVEQIHADRICKSGLTQCRNARMHGSEQIINHSELTEDMARRQFSSLIAGGQMKINW